MLFKNMLTTEEGSDRIVVHYLMRMVVLQTETQTKHLLNAFFASVFYTADGLWHPRCTEM